MHNNWIMRDARYAIEGSCPKGSRTNTKNKDGVISTTSSIRDTTMVEFHKFSQNQKFELKMLLLFHNH